MLKFTLIHPSRLSSHKHKLIICHLVPPVPSSIYLLLTLFSFSSFLPFWPSISGDIYASLLVVSTSIRFHKIEKNDKGIVEKFMPAKMPQSHDGTYLLFTVVKSLMEY